MIQVALTLIIISNWILHLIHNYVGNIGLLQMIYYIQCRPISGGYVNFVIIIERVRVLKLKTSVANKYLAQDVRPMDRHM